MSSSDEDFERNSVIGEDESSDSSQSQKRGGLSPTSLGGRYGNMVVEAKIDENEAASQPQKANGESETFTSIPTPQAPQGGGDGDGGRGGVQLSNFPPVTAAIDDGTNGTIELLANHNTTIVGSTHPNNSVATRASPSPTASSAEITAPNVVGNQNSLPVGSNGGAAAPPTKGVDTERLSHVVGKIKEPPLPIPSPPNRIPPSTSSHPPPHEKKSETSASLSPSSVTATANSVGSEVPNPKDSAAPASTPTSQEGAVDIGAKANTNTTRSNFVLLTSTALRDGGGESGGPAGLQTTTSNAPNNANSSKDMILSLDRFREMFQQGTGAQPSHNGNFNAPPPQRGTEQGSSRGPAARLRLAARESYRHQLEPNNEEPSSLDESQYARKQQNNGTRGGRASSAIVNNSVGGGGGRGDGMNPSSSSSFLDPFRRSKFKNTIHLDASGRGKLQLSGGRPATASAAVLAGSLDLHKRRVGGSAVHTPRRGAMSETISASYLNAAEKRPNWSPPRPLHSQSGVLANTSAAPPPLAPFRAEGPPPSLAPPVSVSISPSALVTTASSRGVTPSRGPAERALDRESALQVALVNMQHDFTMRERDLLELRVKTQHQQETMQRTEAQFVRAARLGVGNEADAVQSLLDNLKSKNAHAEQKIRMLEEELYHQKQNARAAKTGELKVQCAMYLAEIQRLRAALLRKKEEKKSGAYSQGLGRAVMIRTTKNGVRVLELSSAQKGSAVVGGNETPPATALATEENNRREAVESVFRRLLGPSSETEDEEEHNEDYYYRDETTNTGNSGGGDFGGVMGSTRLRLRLMRDDRKRGQQRMQNLTTNANEEQSFFAKNKAGNGSKQQQTANRENQPSETKEGGKISSLYIDRREDDGGGREDDALRQQNGLGTREGRAADDEENNSQEEIGYHGQHRCERRNSNSPRRVVVDTHHNTSHSYYHVNAPQAALPAATTNSLRQRDERIVYLERRLEAAVEEYRLAEAEGAKWRLLYNTEKPQMEEAHRRIELYRGVPAEMEKMRAEIAHFRDKWEACEARAAREAEIRKNEGERFTAEIESLSKEVDKLKQEILLRGNQIESQAKDFATRNQELDAELKVKIASVVEHERGVAKLREDELMREIAGANERHQNAEAASAKQKDEYEALILRKKVEFDAVLVSVKETMGREFAEKESALQKSFETERDEFERRAEHTRKEVDLITQKAAIGVQEAERERSRSHELELKILAEDRKYKEMVVQLASLQNQLAQQSQLQERYEQAAKTQQAQYHSQLQQIQHQHEAQMRELQQSATAAIKAASDSTVLAKRLQEEQEGYCDSLRVRKEPARRLRPFDQILSDRQDSSGAAGDGEYLYFTNDQSNPNTPHALNHRGDGGEETHNTNNHQQQTRRNKAVAMTSRRPPPSPTKAENNRRSRGHVQIIEEGGGDDGYSSTDATPAIANVSAASPLELGSTIRPPPPATHSSRQLIGVLSGSGGGGASDDQISSMLLHDMNGLKTQAPSPRRDFDGGHTTGTSTRYAPAAGGRYDADDAASIVISVAGGVGGDATANDLAETASSLAQDPSGSNPNYARARRTTVSSLVGADEGEGNRDGDVGRDVHHNNDTSNTTTNNDNNNTNGVLFFEQHTTQNTSVAESSVPVSRGVSSLTAERGGLLHKAVVSNPPHPHHAAAGESQLSMDATSRGIQPPAFTSRLESLPSPQLINSHHLAHTSPSLSPPRQCESPRAQLQPDNRGVIPQPSTTCTPPVASASAAPPLERSHNDNEHPQDGAEGDRTPADTSAGTSINSSMLMAASVLARNQQLQFNNSLTGGSGLVGLGAGAAAGGTRSDNGLSFSPQPKMAIGPGGKGGEDVPFGFSDFGGGDGSSAVQLRQLQQHRAGSMRLVQISASESPTSTPFEARGGGLVPPASARGGGGGGGGGDQQQQAPFAKNNNNSKNGSEAVHDNTTTATGSGLGLHVISPHSNSFGGMRSVSEGVRGAEGGGGKPRPDEGMQSSSGATFIAHHHSGATDDVFTDNKNSFSDTAGLVGAVSGGGGGTSGGGGRYDRAPPPELPPSIRLKMAAASATVASNANAFTNSAETRAPAVTAKSDFMRNDDGPPTTATLAAAVEEALQIDLSMPPPPPAQCYSPQQETSASPTQFSPTNITHEQKEFPLPPPPPPVSITTAAAAAVPPLPTTILSLPMPSPIPRAEMQLAVGSLAAASNVNPNVNANPSSNTPAATAINATTATSSSKDRDDFAYIPRTHSIITSDERNMLTATTTSTNALAAHLQPASGVGLITKINNMSFSPTTDQQQTHYHNVPLQQLVEHNMGGSGGGGGAGESISETNSTATNTTVGSRGGGAGVLGGVSLAVVHSVAGSTTFAGGAPPNASFGVGTSTAAFQDDISNDDLNSTGNGGYSPIRLKTDNNNNNNIRQQSGEESKKHAQDGDDEDDDEDEEEESAAQQTARERIQSALRAADTTNGTEQQQQPSTPQLSVTFTADTFENNQKAVAAAGAEASSEIKRLSPAPSVLGPHPPRPSSLRREQSGGISPSSVSTSAEFVRKSVTFPSGNQLRVEAPPPEHFLPTSSGSSSSSGSSGSTASSSSGSYSGSDEESDEDDEEDEDEEETTTATSPSP